ncbi:Hypothetical predicted protein [Octopus vulgaris]|uniref:Uncharacterized protein n=1 Tax=Octopus vulgaris TaxID=6645 RepID=A0AA36FDI1_OCTVU|nr:Hypothetical predicted protein [Octopus vulgaris]
MKDFQKLLLSLEIDAKSNVETEGLLTAAGIGNLIFRVRTSSVVDVRLIPIKVKRWKPTFLQYQVSELQIDANRKTKILLILRLKCDNHVIKVEADLLSKT